MIRNSSPYSVSDTGWGSFEISPPVENKTLLRILYGALDQAYVGADPDSNCIIPFGSEHTSDTAYAALEETMNKLGYFVTRVQAQTNAVRI